MAKILIIDDDNQVRTTFTEALTQQEHICTPVETLASGLKAAREEKFDIVLLDVNLPDASGLTAVRELTSSPGNPEVIIITGFGGPDSAAKAIQEGAWDYIVKPPSFSELKLCIERALEYRRQKGASQTTFSIDRVGIVGQSKALQNCLDKVAIAAGSLANVLITGESGTGKELFAKAIHANSARHEGPFVVLDCSSLPESLAESLLFGHEKGSFTGADKKQEGIITQACSGTLFMDEIGELPLLMQSKFLRVLQERQYRSLGADRETASDFRLVAATNNDLHQMTEEGAFREDLYFRIKTLHIELPPLRERKEDIPDLARDHVRHLCLRYGLEMKKFSPDFFKMLQVPNWPGNIRQLQHVVELALINGQNDPMLFAKHLPEDVRIQALNGAHFEQPEPALDNGDSETKASLRTPEGTPRSWSDFKEEVLGTLEKAYLQDLLAHHEGNVKDAAGHAGLGLSRFYELLKRHAIRTR